jgi:dTDP-4-dehydrorhamnose reductase
MSKVLVLGAAGMLGRMLARVLAPQPAWEVTTTSRSDRAPTASVLEHCRFDAVRDPLGPLLDRDRYDWVINAIGVIKPRIDERSPASIENALRVNALFPYALATETAARGQKVLQIATDGVFSGAGGPYDESAPHDPVDVYGKTKSFGEVPAPHVHHLRCSIIGPEPPPAASLLGWALSSPAGSQLRGFTAQRWTGVTTLQFARLCAAVVNGAGVRSGQHVVPADSVTKADLLKLALDAFGRDDVTVVREPGPESIDRRLATRDPAANDRLWRSAGYEAPPSVGDMVRELAAFERLAPDRVA